MLLFSQVSFEKSISKRKVIKTRSRTTISDNLLEAFVFISCEQKLFDSAQFEDALENVKRDSKTLILIFFFCAVCFALLFQ